MLTQRHKLCVAPSEVTAVVLIAERIGLARHIWRLRASLEHGWREEEQHREARQAEAAAHSTAAVGNASCGFPALGLQRHARHPSRGVR